MVLAVAPTPVNVLVTDPSWMTLDALQTLGVRRVSIGSALARIGWRAVLAAADEMASGSFASLASAEPFADLERRFGG